MTTLPTWARQDGGGWRGEEEEGEGRGGGEGEEGERRRGRRDG